MSRFSDQDKREILLGNGADPAIHDLTDDGFIVSKVSTAQPAITNTPVSPDTTKFEPLSPTGDSPLTTGIKSFAQAAPSGLAAGAGMGAGFAIGGALAPATGGLSFLIPLLTGLAGGGLAGMGARKVQEAVEPESWTANVEASRQLNPLAGDVGELASLVTSGFRPSIKNLTTTAGAIPKLLTGQSLTGAEKLAGMNVGLGTGLGVIQPTVESLATTGQLPAGSDLLKSAAVGSLLTEPWALGRKFGFHNSVVPRELPGIEDTVAAGGPVALNPQPDISGATVTPSDVSLLNRITGATWKDTKKGAQLVPAGTGTLSEVGAAETSARNMQEAFDKGLPTVENPGLRTFEIKAAEAEKSRQDWEEAKAQNEALKRAQTDNETARLKAENERMAEELKAGLQPKLEAAPLPPPKVTTELGREIHPDYTGVVEDLNTQVKNESQADLEARRLEGNKDRYSEKSALDEAPIGTEFTGEVVSKVKSAGISPERTPSWKTKWGQFLNYKRGIKVVNGEVINEVTGQRVAGRTIKNKVGEIVNEIDNVKGKLDTDAHEGIHGFIDSIRDTPLYKRFEQLVSSSPEFQAINEARTKAGAERWTPEEYIATEQGYEFLDRNLGLKGETPLKTWWKDFSSHIKTKFGKGGSASPEDYRRILQYKFQYDKATGKSKVSGPVAMQNQNTSELSDDYKYYSERLANPELLDKAIEVKYANNPQPELAVPIGGSRRSGSVGSAGLTKDEASNIFEQLKNKEGYPNLRMDSKTIRGTDWYNVQWGESTPKNHPTSQGPEWDALGEQYGYKKNKPTDKDWQVTVQPEEPGIPGTGYVQIDDITGGVNHWSKGPESLGKEGYVVPDFKKLPMGKYKYEDAVKKLGYSEKSELADEPSLYLTAPKVIEKLGGTADGKQWIGTLVNKINPFEMSMLKEAGIENFLADGSKKSSKEVADWIRANGPKVEVHSYGMEGKVSEAKKEYDKMTHEWYEPLGSKRRDEYNDYASLQQGYDQAIAHWSDADKAKAKRYNELNMIVPNEPRDTSPRATSAYSHVSPLPTNEPMPEWTATKSGKNVQRVDVVIPSDSKVVNEVTKAGDTANAKLEEMGYDVGIGDQTGEIRGVVHRDTRQQTPTRNLTGELKQLVETAQRGELEKRRLHKENKVVWTPDNLHENLPNTLGWAMIQYKTGPKGEKIAVIAEAQSRWGQEIRERKTKEAPYTSPGAVAAWKETGRKIDHPLLRDYNRLILKSAIEQARKEGATHIVVSDAETAMMTEGHDTVTRHIAPEGEYVVNEIAGADTQWLNPQTHKLEDAILTGKIKTTPSQEHRGSNEPSNSTRAETADGRWIVVRNERVKGAISRYLYEKSTSRPEQEPGMRLNYDTILPKIAEELTGSKGEKVSLGEHKNAIEKGSRIHSDRGFDTKDTAVKHYNESLERGINSGDGKPVYTKLHDGTWTYHLSYPRENLIFRNADGTPKTDVSGRMYDISNTPEKFSLTAKRYSEQSELSDPNVDKVTKLGEQAFDDSIEAASYENELGAYNAGDLSNKFYKLRGVLNGSKLDVRNSEKSELGDTHYKASFVPFMTARFDKIAENLKSPTAKMVTDNLNNFAAEHDILTGRIGNELIAAGKDFSEQEQQRVYRYAHQMSVNGDSNMTLTGREKKLFNTRLSIIQDVRKLQNELGLKVKAGKEFRAGGIDPKGYIFSEIDPAVANTWAEKPNSSKAKEYDAAYIKHMTDHGISLQDATQALHEYKGAIGSNVPMDVEFGALRKAAGVGLPWELIDKNFNSAAIRYARRASRDLAYFKWIQSNPKMLKALDLRDQYGRLPTVEDVKDVENIAPNAAVKQAMRSVEGVSDNNINPTTMAYARAANNTIMGVGTAARNILNMPAFIASYVQASQLPKVAQAISHMSESRVRAFKNNAVRAGFEDFDAAGYYLGNPNPTIRLLNRYSELARKYQGRNLSDKFEGEYYYSLGELLATDNIAKAKEGNKESKAFVSKFGATVDKGADSLLTRKVTQDDVERMAKAFVDAARGTYGPSGLPSFAIEGQLSPFFALSRFSIEKANTIWKDVVEPARKGIYGPAIRYILGSAGVGYAIEALNEELANKRGGEPTVSEVLQSGSKEDIMAKVISTAQLASFAGIVSDGAQLVSNAARGKGLAYSNPVSFPLYTLVTDTFGRNIADAANAIKEGEDPFTVLGKLATVLSTQSVQTMRYLDAHVLHPDEAKRKEKFRDYNVWMQLTDRAQPEQSGKANEFKNLGSKEFKREDDLGKAASMIPKLVESAIEKSKDRNGNIDPVKLSENFKSLKLNSYQIMPALEKDPRAFAEYYQHVNETQGSDKAKNLLTDFMSQREINKVKNSMVPSL